MPDKKANPLIGAFRTPVPGTSSDKPAEDPKTAAGPKAASTTPDKPAEAPKTVADPKAASTAPGKPAEAPKAAADPKAASTAPGKPAEAPKTAADPKAASTAPGKPAEAPKAAADPKAASTAPGKPTEAPKAAADPKATSTAPGKLAEAPKAAADPKTASTTPGKPAEDPKTAADPKATSTVPGKPAEDPKTAADPKATSTAPGKSAEAPKAAADPKAASTAPGKPTEDPKAATDPKDDKAGTAVSSSADDKPKENKAVTGPGSSPSSVSEKTEGNSERAAEGPKGANVTKIFADRLDPPTEADLHTLPIPEGDEVFAMAVHPAYLRDFLEHPFSINRETQDYKELYESIERYGIQEPVKCRPGRNGGLEIISGHRRHDIGVQLNYPIPIIIQQIDEDDAAIQCVDGNLHRQDIPLSELARAAQMKMDALRRKAGRRSKEEKAADPGPQKRSDEIVGEDLGMSRASVQRLMRVNKLEEPLKKMVDKKELPLDTAEQISHMKPEEQKKLANAIEKEGGKVPSKSEAVKLKEESKAGTLTEQKIEKSVAPTKREETPPLKVTLTEEELRPFFPDKRTTIPDAKQGIFEALNLRKKALERREAKAQTGKPVKAAKETEPVR